MNAQELKNIIIDHEYCASNNHDRDAFDADAYYAAKREAMALAYDHTFGKGYNPEAMDEMAIGMAEVIKILHKEGRVNLSTALQSILEKAKLK